jgi:uncharacterized membrane protein required for colicin V production
LTFARSILDRALGSPLSCLAGGGLLTTLLHFSHKKVDTTYTKIRKPLSEDFLEF